MIPDPERDIRQYMCPSDEYLHIHDYLTRHGCQVTYMNTEVEEDGFQVTYFLVARPPRVPK